MILDSYSFPNLPGSTTLIEEDKISASVLTQSSVVYFSWGMSIKGKTLVLTWAGMTTVEFDALQTKYAADVQVVFDPEQGDAKTYNVEIVGLTGTYHMSVLDSATYRTNIVMNLLIMSEV